MAGFFRKRSLKARDDQVTNASELTLKQSLVPLCLVTILFFLWGFAYGLLDVLNKHFQNTLSISRSRSSGLQAAYFGAYPIASLTYAGWVLRKFGYKATFMLGLVLYGIGSLLFWPAGVNRSFGGFCGATFVIGSGLGTLESAANPYLAVCGPPRYSELRLNLAQAFQAVGTVVGPVLASQVFFKNVGEDANSLRNVQWVYLGIAVFVFLLSGVFYVAHIPEVTDADMERQVTDTGVKGVVENQGKGGWKDVWKEWNMLWAAGSQFCYVGSQVAVASYFVNYVVETRPPTSSAAASNFLAAAQGCFAVGRFLGSGLMKFWKPRKVFLGFFTMVLVFSAMSIGTRGNAGLASLMLVLFFESICFPTIFTLGIRGLGIQTKRGSTVIIGSLIGGAVVPPLLGVAADSFNDTGRAMCVPLVFFVVGYTYPVAVNAWGRIRTLVDGFGESTVGLERGEGKEGSVTMVEGVEETEEKENGERREEV